MQGKKVVIERDLYDDAVKEAKANFMSVEEQIILWTRIGKNALDNPEIPAELIKNILIAKVQISEPFALGK